MHFYYLIDFPGFVFVVLKKPIYQTLNGMESSRIFAG